MADPISVQCPHCKVKLKLKAAPPAGKKVGCPKCKKPFPVKAPPKKKDDDDFLDALDDLSEDDYDAPEDENTDEQEELPARSTMRSRSGVTTKKGGKGKKGRSKKSSAGPILAIIGGSVAALALVAGLVYLLMNLPAGGGGIRSASGEFIAFAPADAELFIAARPADIVASPVLASFIQDPNAKRGLDEFEKTFVFPVAEIEHAFFAIKVDPNAAKGGQPGRPMAGNPMMGLPGGLGGMPGMGGGNRSGVQDGVVILRLKNPHGGKGLDQLRQQFPPKTYKDVTYHVGTGPNAPGFFFGDERHVVMTEPATIERVIDRKDQSENNDLLTYFAKDQHFTMVATPKGTDAQASLPPGFQSPQFENLQKLAQDISKFRLDVNMPSGVDLKVTVTCKTDSGAQQILAEANKGIDGLKQQALVLKFMFPDIDSVLNTLKVSGSGANVEGSVSVSSTVIDNLKKMSSQQPGAGTFGAGLPGQPQSPGAIPTGAFPATGSSPGAAVPGAILPGAFPQGTQPGAFPQGSAPGATPKGVPAGAFPQGAPPGTARPTATPPASAPPGAVPPSQ